MDAFEHYRCRHIYLKASDEASKQAEAACHAVAGIEGILLAAPIDTSSIHLIYSLNYFSFELIIDLLGELGFECENSVLLSLRNTIYQFLEENARDNMALDTLCFEEKLPEHQDIPHQSTEKYWEDYH
ncbi:MAG: hypothetical protein ACC663_00160 [Gammaproteobacteria bacterium]